MSNMIAVGESGEFIDGTMKEVLAGGREILVVRFGDKYYATDNRCTIWEGSCHRVNWKVRWLPVPGTVLSLT